MKLFLMIIALLIAIPVLTIDSMRWTQSTKEELELRAIMQRIAQINEYFSSLGARNSSSRHGAIFGYLKQKRIVVIRLKQMTL